MRLIAGALIDLFILSITIPDLGSINIAKHKISYDWHDALSIAVIVTPFIFIVSGAIYSRIIEFIGWILLFLAVFFRFASYATT